MNSKHNFNKLNVTNSFLIHPSKFPRMPFDFDLLMIIYSPFSVNWLTKKTHRLCLVDLCYILTALLIKIKKEY